MNRQRKLNNCRIGDIIEIDNNHGIQWRVEYIRDSLSKNGLIEPDTLRRHPERLRSRYMARLRNLKTGRLKCVWFAEFIGANLIGEILSDHAKQRCQNREISIDLIDKVLKFGRKKFTKKGNMDYYLSYGDTRHSEFLSDAGGVHVIKSKDGIIITSFRDK